MPSAFTPTTPTWADGPGGGTDIDMVDLQEHTNALLALNSAVIVMTWDGTTYQPSTLRGDTSRPRKFIGPVDPVGVSGVSVAAFDTWLQTSS